MNIDGLKNKIEEHKERIWMIKEIIRMTENCVDHYQLTDNGLAMKVSGINLSFRCEQLASEERALADLICLLKSEEA